MSSNSTLFDALQRSFCPPLDSSLVAALVADIESDAQGNPLVPTSQQIDDLRGTLAALSSQADESQLSEISGLSLTLQTDEETSSTPEFCNSNTATSSSFNSDSCQHPFSSPLGFLQAALPHLPTKDLVSALEGVNNDDIDMWDIVAGLLTSESIREMEERGMDTSGDEEGLEDEKKWETVKKKRLPITKEKKRKGRGKTIALLDVRQQQPSRSSSHPRPTIKRSAIIPDPWTQLTSLSSHLATILPPHPPSFFQSYFHSPDHASPYIALHACLRSICQNQPEFHSEEYTDALFVLFDILLPQYEDLDLEQQSRLVSDIEMALQATCGRGDDALDLAKLLRDLDPDSADSLEMGIYHSPPQSPRVESHHMQTLPIGPPSPSPVPSRLRGESVSLSPDRPKKPSPFQWQFVPQRRSSNYDPHPLAAHIPAYTRDVNGIKVRGNGSSFGQGSKGELGRRRRNMEDSMRKRDELLRQATQMWQRGSSKTRGGEVAFYFAERAREVQVIAREEALMAARTMVESKRLASGDPYTIDLHGTTVAEAIVIVKEALEVQNVSSSKPLKIITGRGAHSVNQVGVLKPAIKKALEEDGWIVGSWHAGLDVRGKH